MDKGGAQTNGLNNKEINGYVLERLLRIYKSSKKELIWLASAENYVDASIQRLEDYIEKEKERLITAAKKTIGNIRIDRKKQQNVQCRNRRKNIYFRLQTGQIASREELDVAAK